MRRSAACCAALVLAALPGCKGAGSFTIDFTWDGPAPTFDSTVHFAVRVEERAGGTPTLLATAGPEIYTPQLRLEMPNVPNGDNRVVVAELRDGAGSAAQVLYYGESEPFALRAGEHVVVPVALALVATPSVTGGGGVTVLGGGAARIIAGAEVALRLVTDTGVTVRVSNLVGLPEAQTVSQELADLDLGPAAPAGWRSYVMPWDLERDLAALCVDTDRCARRVFVRFVDERGYESAVASDEITLDTRLPELVADASTIAPEASRYATRPVLTLVANEPLGAAPEVLVDGLAAPFTLAFPGAGEPISSSTYIFVASMDAGDAWTVGPHAVTAVLTDLAGNVTGALPAVELNVDSTLPDVTNVSITPGVVRQGQAFVLAFELTETPLAPPVVRVGQLVMPAGECVATDLDYECAHTATLAEGDGDKPVRIDLVDLASNSHSADGGTVRYDVTPPLGVTATLVRTPFFGAATDPAQDLVRFTATDAFTGGGVYADLYVFANEPLGSEPSLQVLGPGALAFADLPVLGSTAHFQRRIDELDDPGSYTFEVTWADAIGNVGTVALTPTLVIDRTAPVPAVAQSQITFLRSPWGSAASQTLASGLLIPPGPYFSLGPPGDGLSYPASTFTIDGGAAASSVRVWAGLDSTGAPRSNLDNFAANGDLTWPRRRLAEVDTRAVFVTLLDAAGNESSPVKIERAEWVATPNPPVFGESPHRLQSTRYARAARDPDSGDGVTVEQTGAEGVGGSSTAAVAEGVWRVFATTAAPPQTEERPVVYDSIRGVTVLFGGYLPSRGVTHELWEWDGDRWRGPFEPGVRPAPRHQHAMVYDSVRGRVIVFGGTNSANPTILYDDLWEWDGQRWHGPYVSSNQPPGPALQLACAFDSRRGRMVVLSEPSAELNEIWEWDGSIWHHAEQTNPWPSYRYKASMAFDSVAGKVMMFGAANGTDGADELWAWDGEIWAARRAGVATAAASRRSRAGSRSGAGSPGPVRRVQLQLLDDLWEWDGEDWEGPFALGGLPGPRRGNLVYDVGRARAVLFGGSEEIESLGDAWEWDGTAWSGPRQTFGLPAAPPIDAEVHLVPHESGGVQFYALSFPYNEVWRWNAGAWSAQTPQGTYPGWRSSFTLSRDTDRGRLVLFGGNSLRDVWEWDDVAFGAPLTPTPRPSAREYAAATYDSARDRVVLFGGSYNRVAPEDVWEWDGEVWWGPFAPSPRPGQRFGHTLAYDAQRGRVVMFGGSDGSNDDVWEWDGDEWFGPFRPSPRPSARASPGLASDSDRGRIILFGGTDVAFAVSDPNYTPSDVWEWDGVVWHGPFLPEGRPTGRWRPGLAEDGARRSVVLVGGDDSYADTPYSVDKRQVFVWDSLQERRPAVQFSASYLGSGLTRAAMQSLRVRAHCGGVFAPYNPSDTGAELLVWRVGGEGPAGWEVLAGNASSTPSLMEWPAAGAPASLEVQAYAYEGASQLSFQCRPAGVSGLGAAEVVMDSIEVRVTYDTRLCGDRYRDSNEECDDGEADDGCAPDCTLE